MTRDKANPTDQIKPHRTKGSDFLAAFVQFGFHCSCVVQTPATDNRLTEVPDWKSSHWRSKSTGTKTVYGKKEHSDFLIVKLSFILYLTTQESTSEAGLFSVRNTDISEQAPNASKHAEKYEPRLISDTTVVQQELIHLHWLIVYKIYLVSLDKCWTWGT